MCLIWSVYCWNSLIEGGRSHSVGHGKDSYLSRKRDCVYCNKLRPRYIAITITLYNDRVHGRNSTLRDVGLLEFIENRPLLSYKWAQI